MTIGSRGADDADALRGGNPETPSVPHYQLGYVLIFAGNSRKT